MFAITPAQNNNSTYTLTLYYTTSELSTGFTVAPAALSLLKTKEAFVIFPNPARGSVTISLDGFVNNARINITDGKGQVVQKGVIRQSSAMQLDVSHLPVGTYYVELLSSKVKQVRKLVISR